MAVSDPTDPGFKVTVKDVYNDVQKILERLPDDLHNRLRKAEVQIAAQWVVAGLVIAGVGGLIARTFNG